MRLTVLFIALILLLCSAAVPGLADTEIYQAPKQVVITFTGDCTLGCDPLERGRSSGFESYIDQYGYGYPFEKVRHIFEQDDLTVINLEGTFYNSDANAAPDKTYHFRGPTDYVQILTEASIEACSIGNNHILDYGVPGMESTIETLEQRGIAWFGTTEYCNGTYIYEKDGVKIGFYSIYYSDWVTVIKTAAKDSIAALKEAGCNLIVACIHVGVEYDTRHDLNQEKMADAFIRYGADVVIGNHPHSIQGIREQDGVCTLWSLGNFAFGGNSSVVISRKKSVNFGKININSFIAQFIFSFDENNAYLGHQLTIIPCYTTGTGTEKNNYQPIPVTGTDAEKVMKAIQDDTPYRRLLLNPYVEGVGAVQEFVPCTRQK